MSVSVLMEWCGGSPGEGLMGGAGSCVCHETSTGGGISVSLQQVSLVTRKCRALWLSSACERRALWLSSACERRALWLSSVGFTKHTYTNKQTNKFPIAGVRFTDYQTAVQINNIRGSASHVTCDWPKWPVSMC